MTKTRQTTYKWQASISISSIWKSYSVYLKVSFSRILYGNSIFDLFFCQICIACIFILVSVIRLVKFEMLFKCRVLCISWICVILPYLVIINRIRIIPRKLYISGGILESQALRTAHKRQAKIAVQPAILCHSTICLICNSAFIHHCTGCWCDVACVFDPISFCTTKFGSIRSVVVCFEWPKLLVEWSNLCIINIQMAIWLDVVFTHWFSILHLNASERI